MIGNPKKFIVGVCMLAGFVAVLAVIFSPVFGGENGLVYLDSLYNSISKGSAYYLPEVKEKTAGFSTHPVTATLSLGSEKAAGKAAALFEAGGCSIRISGAKLSVSGNLGGIFKSCIEDSELMYYNDGRSVASKYNMDGKLVLYTWHNALKALNKDLTRQEKFKEAEIVTLVLEKAVDLSYNYYTIEPKRISDCMGVVVLSLVFYVVYTLWFGFAILFLFEGWGIQLEH